MEYDNNAMDALEWLFEEWKTTKDTSQREDTKRDIKAIFDTTPKLPLEYYKKASEIITA